VKENDFIVIPKLRSCIQILSEVTKQNKTSGLHDNIIQCQLFYLLWFHCKGKSKLIKSIGKKYINIYVLPVISCSRLWVYAHVMSYHIKLRKYYQKSQNKTKRAVCTITLSNVSYSTYYDSIARQNQNGPRALGKSILIYMFSLSFLVHACEYTPMLCHTI